MKWTHRFASSRCLSEMASRFSISFIRFLMYLLVFDASSLTKQEKETGFVENSVCQESYINLNNFNKTPKNTELIKHPINVRNFGCLRLEFSGKFTVYYCKQRETFEPFKTYSARKQVSFQAKTTRRELDFYRPFQAAAHIMGASVNNNNRTLSTAPSSISSNGHTKVNIALLLILDGIKTQRPAN